MDLQSIEMAIASRKRLGALSGAAANEMETAYLISEIKRLKEELSAYEDAYERGL